jgi:hypothetical protein
MSNHGMLDLKDFYDYTTQQIERENDLINNRLSWMLTFQGFLFAALALVVNKDTEPAVGLIFKNVLPIIGIAVALLAFLGVLAAYISIDNIKQKWKKQLGNQQYPPAHGTPLASFLGRITSYGIPISIVIAWLLIRSGLTLMPLNK